MPGVNKSGRGLGSPSPPQEKLGRGGTGQRTGGREEASNWDRRRGQGQRQSELKSVEPTGRPVWGRGRGGKKAGVGQSWRRAGCLGRGRGKAKGGVRRGWSALLRVLLDRRGAASPHSQRGPLQFQHTPAGGAATAAGGKETAQQGAPGDRIPAAQPSLSRGGGGVPAEAEEGPDSP